MSRIERLTSFFAADPGNAILAAELADALSLQAEYARASEVLQQLPAAGRAEPGIRMRLARCALALGDYLAAERELEVLVAKQTSVPVCHDLAFAQLCRGDLDAAEQTVRAAAEQFPDAPDLLALAARIALHRHDYKGAHAALDQALARAPDSANALGLRALALLDAGELPAAAAAARRCLERHPQQHEALIAAGSCALAQRDGVAAIAHFDRALLRHPNSGRARSGRGQALMLLNRLPEAVTELRAATDALAAHIGTWHARAWAELLSGQHEAAESCYRQALALDRNFGESHGGLALVLTLAGRVDEAEQSLQRALRLDPHSFTARYARLLGMQRSGHHDAGSHEFEHLLHSGGVDAASVPSRALADWLRATLTAQVAQ